MNARRRFRTSPLAWLAVGLLLVLALTGCKSEEQLATERAEREGTSVPTATVATTATATAPTATATAPTATPEVVATSPIARYVANTGGDGISLRSDCRNDARIAGAWTEGTRVEVVQVGSGDCDGWTLTASGSTETWVSNQYLASNAPSTAVRPAGSTSTPSPNPTTSPPASTPAASGVAGEFEVIDHWFTFDQWGFPNLNYTVRNLSNEAIVDFAIDICLFDPAGQPVRQHGSGPTCFQSTHLDISVPAGGTFTPRQITTWAWGAARSATFDPLFARTPTTYWRP